MLLHLAVSVVDFPPAMPFSLRLTGNEVAQNFSAHEVTLGRARESDVVIRDINASRRHARIIEREGAHFLEDLKSHFGTTVNSAPIQTPTRLAHGDRIGIGAVIIEFIAGKPPEVPQQPPPPPAHLVSDLQTRLNAMPEGPPPSFLGPLPLPARHSPPSHPHSAPHAHPAPHPVAGPHPVPPPQPLPVPPPLPVLHPLAVAEVETRLNQMYVPLPPAEGGETRIVSLPPGAPLSLAHPPPQDVSEALTDLKKLAVPLPPGGLPSDLARHQRELRKSRPRRVALALVAAGLFSGLTGGLLWLSSDERPSVRVAPPTLIPNGEPLVESFGLGDKVVYPVSGAQTFTFTAVSPTKLLGIVHLKSASLSAGEVMVELNTVPIRPLPADDLAPEQESEVVLPARLIKIGVPNTLIFDHTLNPPNADSWRVWNVWVETIPVPDVTVEQAVATARAAFLRSDELSQARAVGSMNLFRAWKGYREAWLVLEATDGRPDGYVKIAEQAMKRHRLDLDKVCSNLLIDYELEMAKKRPSLRKARKILRNIPNYFGKEHPCYALGLYLQRSLIEE